MHVRVCARALVVVGGCDIIELMKFSVSEKRMLQCGRERNAPHNVRISVMAVALGGHSLLLFR